MKQERYLPQVKSETLVWWVAVLQVQTLVPVLGHSALLSSQAVLLHDPPTFPGAGSVEDSCTMFEVCYAGDFLFQYWTAVTVHFYHGCLTKRKLTSQVCQTCCIWHDWVSWHKQLELCGAPVLIDFPVWLLPGSVHRCVCLQRPVNRFCSFVCLFLALFVALFIVCLVCFFFKHAEFRQSVYKVRLIGNNSFVSSNCYSHSKILPWYEVIHFK